MHKIFVLQYVYFMPIHVSSTCAHHQEVKIALYSLRYHHTETSVWSKITKVQFYKYEQIIYVNIANYLHFYCVFSKILQIEYLKNT